MESEEQAAQRRQKDAQLFKPLGFTKTIEKDDNKLTIMRRGLPAKPTDKMTWAELPFTKKEDRRNTYVVKSGLWIDVGDESMVGYLSKFCAATPSTGESKFFAKDDVANNLKLTSSALYIINDYIRVPSTSNDKMIWVYLPLGFMTINRTLQTDYAPSIEYLCIHPNFRRNDLAKMLLDFYEDLVRTNFPNLKHITLWVLNNAETRAFFLKNKYDYLTYQEAPILVYERDTEPSKVGIQADYVYMIKLLDNPAVGEKRAFDVAQGQTKQINTYATIQSAKRAEWVIEALRHLQINSK